MRNQRTLIFRAAVAVALWLAALTAFTIHRYPGFWRRPDLQFAHARQLAAAGRNADALAAIDAALTRIPDNPYYLGFKGYRQLDAEDAAGAEASFRRALARAPHDADARLGLAEALRRQGRRAPALRILDGLPPDLDPRRLRLRSQMYGEMAMPGPALQDLSVLLRQRPADPDLLKEAAVHASSLRDWPQVASLADRLAAAAPDLATKRWALAALAHAIQAVLPPPPPVVVAVADDPFALLARGQTSAAEMAFRRRVAADGGDLRAREGYAWLLNTQHRYDEAWQLIAALPQPSDDVALLELQARTAMWAGRAREAVPLGEAWLRVRPLDAGAWKDLAELLDRQEDREASIAAYRRYLQLRSQDAPARQSLAEALARVGSLDAAIAEFAALAAREPENAARITRLGVAQETAGRLQEARASYRLAIEHATGPSPDLLLRMARLSRWLSEPAAAAAWYRRYLAVVDDPVLARQARSELALSLLDAGRPAETLAELRGIEGGAALPADDLVVAARAATAGREPALAAAYLERAAALRPLTLEERRWQAGQYRAAGNPGAALDAYERLAADFDDADAWIAAADLRFDAGDYDAALDALRRVTPRRDVPLRIARSAARAGRMAEAASAYGRAVAREPDADVRLEAARFLAGAGRAADALQQYRFVIAARGPDGLRLEMARAALANQDFAAAEAWSRQALAAGDDPADAALALAQSLHLQGRSREARAILQTLTAAAPTRPDALVWQGRVAVALDRHLEAYRAFDAAFDAGPDRGERIALWAGTEARKRGDYARALGHYEAASVKGPAMPEARVALRDLAAETMSRVYLPIWGHADSNGLRVAEAGGAVSLPLPRLVGVLTIEGSTGRITQRGFGDRVSRAALDLAHLFVRPSLELGVGAAWNQFERSDGLASWNAAATLWLSDDVRLGLGAARTPVLPFGAPDTLRQFNRVLDVAAIGPAFFGDSVRASADLALRAGDELHVEGGGVRLADGNRQAFAYGQYQLPLAASARTWAVLRPNVFFESFRDPAPGYFSPASHLTLGTMLHAIQQYRRMDVEVEFNPQLLRTDGATGFGGHGLVNLVVKTGRARITAGTFVFYDSLKDYTQWRLAGGVSVPVGRR